MSDHLSAVNPPADWISDVVEDPPGVLKEFSSLLMAVGVSGQSPGRGSDKSTTLLMAIRYFPGGGASPGPRAKLKDQLREEPPGGYQELCSEGSRAGVMAVYRKVPAESSSSPRPVWCFTSAPLSTTWWRSSCWRLTACSVLNLSVQFSVFYFLVPRVGHFLSWLPSFGSRWI